MDISIEVHFIELVLNIIYLYILKEHVLTEEVIKELPSGKFFVKNQFIKNLF
jgi:hypothetical protein